MYFVGIDLAWGVRRPTGVAVLDADGRLVHLSACRTDAEIAAVLTPYLTGRCVVGVDAPLVVTNATGNRPCEQELNQDFARFDSGAHPSNTGKPEFSDGTRGGTLATALGLDLDPGVRGGRRAIEVYPHAATISLFRLGRTLKYKNKPGRSIEQLRDALLVLMHLLEGLAVATTSLDVTHSQDWRRLVADVESAQRKSDLRRVEDQVDAVLCAYVARFAELEPGHTTTYGDRATGQIVTPTLPEGLQPTPRERRPRTRSVQSAVATYTEVQPALQEAASGCVALLTRMLDDAGINYLSITGRAKSVASFAAKANRTTAGVRVFDDPLAQITDQIGLRVITYLHRDVSAVANLLADQFEVLDDRDMGQETASEGRFGYASRHLSLGLDDARRKSVGRALGSRPVQVQIRTVLQHAWAEFEHDIRYKGTIPEEQVPDLDRRFTLAAGLLELADREFSMIRDELQAGMTGVLASTDDDPRITAQELAAFLAGTYADANWSRTDHYSWISGLLLELGIASLEELAEVVRSVDSEALNDRMGYRHPPAAVRRLDDALLASYAEQYLALPGNAERQEMLRARLTKLRG